MDEAFEAWFKELYIREGFVSSKVELYAAWRAATLAERERCAQLVTSGDYCRYVDHNNGTCDCADMAAAIRAS